MKRHTTEPHRVSTNNGKVTDTLTDHILFQLGVKVQCRIEDDWSKSKSGDR